MNYDDDDSSSLWPVVYWPQNSGAPVCADQCDHGRYTTRRNIKQNLKIMLDSWYLSIYICDVILLQNIRNNQGDIGKTLVFWKTSENLDKSMIDF